MKVTIKDIAKVAGVSYSTVSKALNNSPLVKDKTKKKILEIAQKMEYEPNFAAQQLVSKKTKNIGLIWPTIERVVLSTLVTKINAEFKKTSYSMILSVDSIQNSIDTFRRFQVDGIILFEENINQEINPRSIPLLIYGAASDRPIRYPIIDPNHELAMFEAIKYLVKLGHKNISYIGNLSKTDPMQIEKYKGFIKAMNYFGLSVNTCNVVDTCGLSWYDGYRAISELMCTNKLPSAILSGSYDISGGIIRGLKERNIEIPNDVSLISYDNIPQMENMEVPLTSIGVPIEKLAFEIVQTIIELAESGNMEPKVKKLKPELSERNSCKSV